MRNAVWVWALVGLALGVSGCGKKTTGGTAANQAGTKYTIGYSQATLQDPWRRAMDAELDTEAAKHPEAKLLKQDAQNNAATQVNQVQNLQTQGIDALMISPRDSGPLTPIVSSVYKKGIPVILLDRATDNDQYTTLVGADNVLIGERAGAFVKKNFPNGAKIIEIAGVPDASATKERAKGFRQGLGDLKKYAIVSSQPADYLRGKAIDVFTNMLTAHPEVQVVYAHNDEMALGAVNVLDKNARKGVAVIGVDGQKEAIQAVEQGKMTATYVYPRPGGPGLVAALDILSGKKVEKRIVLPTTEITKENAAANMDKGF